jgi:hypothetical protein
MQTLTGKEVSHDVHEDKLDLRTHDNCFKSPVPPYALLFFDHLYSEYLAFKSKITDPVTVQLMESIHQQRLRGQLTWSDIYSFDLTLVDVRPIENLVRKAYDSRAKYRSIAGQKEYDEYLASKPPDLSAILVSMPGKPSKSEKHSGPNGQQTDLATSTIDGKSVSEHAESVELVERILRADIKYLLNKFYLYYSVLPLRESLREQLTSKAVKVTIFMLAAFVGLVVLSFGIIKFQWADLTGAFGLTIGSVAFAGIVGGCVSMLQRIQSAPSEGDALFNLAALSNGWRGLSLSPLYGGIFASLLFVLFAAGILEGTVFPAIKTPGEESTAGCRLRTCSTNNSYESI